MTNVKIVTMEGNFAKLKYYKKMKVFEEETFALLRLCLEEKLALEYDSN